MLILVLDFKIFISLYHTMHTTVQLGSVAPKSAERDLNVQCLRLKSLAALLWLFLEKHSKNK